MQDVEGASRVGGFNDRVTALVLQQYVEHIADVAVVINYQHGRWHRYPTFATSESAAGSGNDGSALVEVSRSVGAWCTQCIWVSGPCQGEVQRMRRTSPDRKSTPLNSSHTVISYAVFC